MLQKFATFMIYGAQMIWNTLAGIIGLVVWVTIIAIFINMVPDNYSSASVLIQLGWDALFCTFLMLAWLVAVGLGYGLIFLWPTKLADQLLFKLQLSE